MRKLFLLVLIVALAIMSFSMVQAQGEFEGQTVVVVTQTGRSIGGPVEDYAPEWEEMTGGDVQLQQFAFGELYEKMIASFETGSIDYDVMIFPADWAGDFMAPGFLEPI